MAVITPSALISEIRGSIGDQTFSKNAFGAYVKAKLTQTNPNSSAQANIRAAVAEANTAWKLISDDTFLQWKEYVSNELTSKNISRKIHRSAFNEFTSRYLNRKLLASAVTDFSALPSSRIFPVIESTIQNFESLVLNWSALDDPGTTAIAVYATAPVNTSVRSFSQSAYKFIGYFNVSTLTGSTDIFSMIDAQFALTASNIGQRISIRIKSINTDNFAASPFHSKDFIIDPILLTPQITVIEALPEYQATSTSHSFSFSSVPEEDELLIFAIAIGTANPSTIPTGFTLLVLTSGIGTKLRIYWKLATAAETNIYTFTTAASSTIRVIGLRITNADPSAPISLIGSSGLSNTISRKASSVDATVSTGEMLLAFFLTASNFTTVDYDNSFGDQVTIGTPPASGFILSEVNRLYTSNDSSQNVTATFPAVTSNSAALMKINPAP